MSTIMEKKRKRDFIEKDIFQKNKKSKKNEIEDLSINVSFFEKNLEETLKCSICLSIMCNPHSLQCGHNFCYNCIENHIYSCKEGNEKCDVVCPYCKTIIFYPPHANYALKNVIDVYCKIVKNESVKEKKIIEDELNKKEFDELEKLKKTAEEAKKLGIEFLKINGKWNNSEKNNFHSVLNNYRGKTRKYFLNLCGLNEHFINNATPKDIFIAFINLKLETPLKIQTIKGTIKHTQDMKKCREILLNFLNCKL